MKSTNLSTNPTNISTKAINMSTKTKAYIAGISLIIASIAGCTYNITTGTKAPSDAIAEGVAGIQDGVKIIKVEQQQEAPVEQQQ